MDERASPVLRFDRFTLDLARGCLRGGAEEIALRPKTYDVLRYLAERSDRLVSKDEVLSAVWPNVFVTDDSLVQCVTELRSALGDREQRIIRTVPRRGYRFVAPVSTVAHKSSVEDNAMPSAASGDVAARPPWSRWLGPPFFCSCSSWRVAWAGDGGTRGTTRLEQVGCL
jgi:DNA-binding winged helix-turn-helix (wHTH) protein